VHVGILCWLPTAQCSAALLVPLRHGFVRLPSQS
jgi:hypothetical protein